MTILFFVLVAQKQAKIFFSSFWRINIFNNKKIEEKKLRMSCSQERSSGRLDTFHFLFHFLMKSEFLFFYFPQIAKIKNLPSWHENMKHLECHALMLMPQNQQMRLPSTPLFLVSFDKVHH